MERQNGVEDVGREKRMSFKARRKVVKRGQGDQDTSQCESEKSTAVPLQAETVPTSECASPPESDVVMIEGVNKKCKLEKSIHQHEKEVSVDVQPLSVFPAEIWNHIFSFIKDPKDVIAVANANIQFNEILTRVKTEKIFSEAFPLIFSSLDKEDILNCRVVCKQWNLSVDECLQNKPLNSQLKMYLGETSVEKRSPPPHYPLRSNNLVSKDLVGIKFETTRAIRWFYNKMKDHPRNPFVLRRVYFDDSGSLNYWREVIWFLRKFGSHIWHLTIHTEAYRDEPFTFNTYMMLRRALGLTPNLRTLGLQGFRSWFDDTSDSEFGRTQENYLDCYLQFLYELPDLPHLHTFLDNISGSFYRETLSYGVLAKYTNHLKKLIVPKSWPICLPYAPHLQHIPELEITLHNYDGDWTHHLGKVEAPAVLKLTVNIMIPWQITELIQLLQKNFSSLVTLQLSIYGKSTYVSQKATSSSPVFLNGVKTLEIVDSPHVNYDEILEYFPGLEYLVVCYTPTNSIESACDEEGKWKIRNWMLSESMYKSKLWGKLLCLKEFIFAEMGDKKDTQDEIISTLRYSREQYNLRKNRASTSSCCEDETST